VSARRFVSLAVAIGVAIPALWLTVYWLFLRGDPALIGSVMSTYRMDRVLLAVWPSWVLFIADPEERSIAIPVVSVAVNALLYGSLGWLVWIGLYRQRTVLAIVVASVLVGWYFLFSWYGG
jgi:hypothetical protein